MRRSARLVSKDKNYCSKSKKEKPLAPSKHNLKSVQKIRITVPAEESDAQESTPLKQAVGNSDAGRPSCISELKIKYVDLSKKIEIIDEDVKSAVDDKDLVDRTDGSVNGNNEVWEGNEFDGVDQVFEGSSGNFESVYELSPGLVDHKVSLSPIPDKDVTECTGRSDTDISEAGDGSNGANQVFRNIHGSNKRSNELSPVSEDYVSFETDKCVEKSFVQDFDNITSSTSIENHSKVTPSFALDPGSYGNLGLDRLTSNPLIQTLLELKESFPFKEFVKRNEKKTEKCNSSMDVFGLDNVMLEKDTETHSNFSSQFSSCVKSSVGFDKLSCVSENTNKLLKRSVLPDDLERMEKSPKLFESVNSLKLKRKKEQEETAGKGWYNLPKSELTDKIKKDLQIVKMRNALDGKHHYKRNDSNKLPKYFEVGTVIEGSQDFYSSRVPKKHRRKTMVDELLADAEFRRKNKKKYIEIRKKQMSGGKAYYKQQKNKHKRL